MSRTLADLTAEEWRASGRRDAEEWLGQGVARGSLGIAARNVAVMLGAPEHLVAVYVAAAEEVAAAAQERGDA